MQHIKAVMYQHTQPANVVGMGVGDKHDDAVDARTCELIRTDAAHLMHRRHRAVDKHKVAAAGEIGAIVFAEKRSTSAQKLQQTIHLLLMM